ncbi:MAG TPA: pentapeptide repeat-containing protein [Thermoanaerobaculia bacterium]|jgi:uncharacterized protein YjbI with pentapeptide repeats|nr:pentapeptide repeat-containing protein [Thermoanaerobaculia bacterium]
MNVELPPLRDLQDEFRGSRAHLERLLDALEQETPGRWNTWRKDHPALRPDLRGVNLSGAHLGDISLEDAILARATLDGIQWWQARLARADLRGASLDLANLSYADLRGAHLERSRLVATNLTMARAERAHFRGANLSHAVLNGVRLHGADLRDATVTGTSSVGIEVDAATRQDDLKVHQWVDPLEDVSDDAESAIQTMTVRVRHLQAVPLIHLLQDQRQLAMIMDAMIDRVVLILGNFGARRKAVLKALQFEIARHGLAPVIFDFPPPEHRDLIETVALIAGFSRFVIADLTRARSTPLESLLIAQQVMLPFASVIHEKEEPFSMFATLRSKYDWLLPTRTYRDERHLVRMVKPIIDECEEKLKGLDRRRPRGAFPSRLRRRSSPTRR